MEIKKSKFPRVNYACGMNSSSCRKLSLFIFGEYLYKVKINAQTKNFDIFVHKTIEGVSFEEKFGKDQIKYFRDFWAETPGFTLLYYLGEHIEIYREL